jgi:hypothetical protein
VSDETREAARQRSIADACLRPDATPNGRLRLYRQLVRNNLRVVVRRLLPRTTAELDRQTKTSFDAWFDGFLAESGPHTPYLRDVPWEFVAWALPYWAVESSLPPFLSDLARYERDRFLVECGLTGEDSPRLVDVALDRRVVLAQPNVLAHYDHEVVGPAEPPPARETHVFLHRDDANTVRSTIVDRHQAALLAQLLEGQTLGAALAKADPTIQDPLALANWLAALGEAGALLGGEG